MASGVTGVVIAAWTGADFSAAAGVAASVLAAGAPLSIAALSFLAGAETLLTQLAALSGGDLNWLQPLYRWLRAKGMIE